MLYKEEISNGWWITVTEEDKATKCKEQEDELSLSEGREREETFLHYEKKETQEKGPN